MSVPVLKPAREELVPFPNPSPDVVRIQGTWPTNARYVLVDALGVDVRSGSLLASSIELTGLDVGMYTVCIKDVVGKTLGTVRLVKE